MPITLTKEKEEQKEEQQQIKQHLSLGKKEAKMIIRIQDELMEHYGYNTRSQLLKELLRDAHTRINLI